MEMSSVLNSVKNIGAYALLSLFVPSFAFAGNYTTTISPSGAEIENPITATFTISDFSQRDETTACVSGFVPDTMVFTYWSDGGANSTDISPGFVPSGEMISSGIYSATFSIPVGQQVNAVGVKFFNTVGVRCEFYGNQPNGVPVSDWSPIIFTVKAAPVARLVVPVTFQNTKPSVEFTGFPTKAVWSGEKTIKYSAIDGDRAPYGLKDFPISLYLSNDGGVIWKELARNESNKGEYSIDTNNFPDGTNYKVKIIALDNENKAGEVISKTFSIDNTKPSFAVEIGSKVIKEKDKINVKITSSENLTETPIVQITQSNGEPQTLIVDGFGKSFSASYTIVKGHVGTAVISIKGKDVAGNNGENITAGETFVVSRLGPPPPVIKNVIDNESFSEQKIDIFGSAPAARKVTFVFNKKETMTVTPDEIGDFSFKNIVLSSSDFGRNTLGFSSIDKDGLESDPRVLTVKLNSPPTVSWAVRPSGTVSGVTHLEWETRDENNDELVSSLWYSLGGKNWDFISKGLLTSQYQLNSNEFFDNDTYFIKVIVDDGSVVSDIISEKLVFKNNNVFSITNAPKNYIFDTVKPVIKGEVRISGNTIVSLKYSFDKETWFNAEAVDGKFDSPFERFVIEFQEPLIDGKQIVFIEAKDDIGNVVKTFQTLIIDTLPPVASNIVFPSSDKTLTMSSDIDEKLGGIQINVLGKAEAGTDLELNVNNKTYSVSADSKGDFIFKKVTFLSRGINRYVLSSSDAAGNLSKIEGLILSNSVPTLSLTTSRKSDFVQGVTEVKWKASDTDGDTLIFQISYRHKGDKNWISLDSNLTASSYTLNFSEFKEGAYELQIIANDGLSETAVVEEIFIDNILPTIKFDSAGSRTVSKIKLIFSGSAEDNLSGIKFVEYSLDGKSWFKAIIAEGYLKKKAFFVIRHPFELEDGVYDFGVRAIDAAGNISKPAFEKIIVDSTPPRVGSFILSYGDIPIFPEGDAFILPASLSLRMRISLERDTQNASVFFGEQKTDFLKNKSTGLWEADVEAGNIGISNILIIAEDALGNITRNKAVGNISVVSSGETIAGAKITILSKNEETQSFTMWPAWSYGLENPISADKNGKYSLLLPAGTYQFLIEKTGYQRLKISDFKVLNTEFINFNFELKPREGIRGKIEDFMERFIFKKY